MSDTRGSKESYERSSQQAERVAREIIKDLEPVLKGGTGDQLEALKGRISGLITDKLQGLDDHTKKTTRSKLEEFLTRREYAEKLPDIFRRMRGVILDVNKEGKRAEVPTSGGGYDLGIPGTLSPEKLDTKGHLWLAAGVTAVGAGILWLLNQAKEKTKKVGGWLKYIVGTGLLFGGAFLGVKTWAEFQQGKEALRRAFEETKQALESARQRLEQATEGPRRTLESLRVSHAYERIEAGLRSDGVRGGATKAQIDLNTRVFPLLKGKEDLQKVFFSNVNRTFPHSFRSKEDIRLEFTVEFTPDKGFEVKERLADTDERLALAEAARGLFGIYANKRDNNYVSELNDPASGMRMDQLVKDRVVHLIQDERAVRSMTIADLRPLAACTTLQECLTRHKALFDKLSDVSNRESQIALWFLAKALARKSVTDPDPQKSIPPGLVEQFIHGMTIDSRFVDSDEKSGQLTVAQVLDRSGQYLRLIARIHDAAGTRNITEDTVTAVFERGFGLKTVGIVETLSPRVRSVLSTLPVRGNEDIFLDFCARHAREYLSVVSQRIEGDGALHADHKKIFEATFKDLHRRLSEPKEYLLFFLEKNGNPLSSDPAAKESLERALHNLQVGDAVQLFLYLEEAKLNNRIPLPPRVPQAHGRFLLHYKVIELISRVSPAIASEMYANFIRS